MDVPREGMGKRVRRGWRRWRDEQRWWRLEEVGKREPEEDAAQLVRPIHVAMKRLRRTDVVKREENYYDYYY